MTTHASAHDMMVSEYDIYELTDRVWRVQLSPRPHRLHWAGVAVSTQQ